MTVITGPEQFNVSDLFINLRSAIGVPIMLKCEGFNFAGSVKLKTALRLITDAEESGTLRPGQTLIESSSGNLGIALSMLAASRGYHLICVTDSRCTVGAQQAMHAYGAEVQIITEADPVTGMLGARLDRVGLLCRQNPNLVWLNQYSNPANWHAHHSTTGPEILATFPEVDVVFLGAGTTGTLMGCARYLRQHRPGITIVAVDSVGSITFGGPAAPRSIPGLGSGVRPPLLDCTLLDDVVLVREIDTIRSCRMLARAGYLLGGSTGTVVSGATRWLDDNPGAAMSEAVAVSPDLGDRYLGTVYADQWLNSVYGPQALAAELMELPSFELISEGQIPLPL